MGMFSWLFSQTPPPSPEETHAIERLVRCIDPRLKALSRLEERLAPAVAQALAYAHQLTRQIPGPLNASPASWQETAELKALFTRSDELQQIFSRQAEVQEFIETHPEGDTLYLILGARVEERNTFGVALNGDTLQHEVPINTLNFSHHRLYLPRHSAAELDQSLIWAIFDQLALELLHKLAASKENQAELRIEIAQLQTQLAHLQGLERALQAQDASLTPPENEGAAPEQLATALQEKQEALGQIQKQNLTLDDTLEWMIHTLQQPELLLPIQSRHYCINSVNQLVDPAAQNAPGTPLTFIHAQITAPSPRQGILLKVHYPRSELIPRATLTQELERLYL